MSKDEKWNQILADLKTLDMADDNSGLIPWTTTDGNISKDALTTQLPDHTDDINTLFAAFDKNGNNIIQQGATQVGKKQWYKEALALELALKRGEGVTEQPNPDTISQEQYNAAKVVHGLADTLRNNETPSKGQSK